MMNARVLSALVSVLLAAEGVKSSISPACGSLGVTIGKPRFVAGGVQPSQVDLTLLPSQSAEVALTWDNNDANLIVPQYEVRLSADRGRTFGYQIGTVDSGNDARMTTSVELLAKEVCPKFCCRAMTATCLSCTAGMSVKQYCRVQADRGVSVVGCEGNETPSEDNNKFCCLSMKADCLACAEGVTVTEYCTDVNPDAVGCDEFMGNSNSTAPEDRSLVASGELRGLQDSNGQKAFCCKALTAECMACEAQVSVIDYCLSHPSTVNCGVVVEAAIQLSSPEPVLGCAYTTVSETFYIRCPREINYEWYEREEGKIGIAAGGASLLVICAGAAIVSFRRKSLEEQFEVDDDSSAGPKKNKKKMSARRMSQLSFPSRASAQDFAAHHGKDLQEALELEAELEEEKKQHKVHLPFSQKEQKAHLEASNPSYNV